MKNIEIIKERYMNTNFSIKLAGLASNLARVESFLENSANKRVVAAILEESKYFIEWITPEASLQIQALLAEIQPHLALWQHFSLREIDNPKNLNKIRKMAKSWSRRLLEHSGLH